MKSTRLIFCICLLLSVLPTSSSWGFEKPAHVEISTKAIELYKELYPAKAEQINEWSALFIADSGKEDDITFSLQRLFNWHFYDPGSRLGSAWWGADRSNTKRFTKLANELIGSAGKGLPKNYELAGRLAHHIQDMSSPPHTVPVYHTTKDPFDKYGRIAKIGEVTLTPGQLDEVRNERGKMSSEALLSLLNNAAQRTISRVEGPVTIDGKEIAGNWTGFWRKYELTGAECGQKPHAGFGCYGKNTFGEGTGLFTPAIFSRFYKEQIAFAIEDTLRLLIFLDNAEF